MVTFNTRSDRQVKSLTGLPEEKIDELESTELFGNKRHSRLGNIPNFADAAERIGSSLRTQLGAFNMTETFSPH